MTTTTIWSSSPSPPPFYLPSRPFSYSLFYAPSHFKKGLSNREFDLVRLSCSGSSQSEPETTSPPLSDPSSSTSNVAADINDDESGGISAYQWCASLGALGFLETSYLTYLKLTGGEALCPTSGSSCNTILTSAYSSVFGVPLPLVGMFSYGVVMILGLKLGEKEAFSVDKVDGEMILVWTTTSMAAASAYFLYILSTEFAGESCLYCLASAVLSVTLFFITLKNFGSDKIQKMLGSQLVVAALVVVALTASYNAAQPFSSSSVDTELPYVETEITKESSPLAFSLAKHLHSIGAKLYGAFWCSHCLDQKEMFGREAAKLLNYVECFPDGVKQGTKMADACYAIELKGFPTWEINGQVLSGEKQLSELAILSAMKLGDSIE